MSSLSKKPLFGQVVIGAPGSGKSTYCNIMADFLRSQKRKVVIVNLDPGNDALPFTATIDVSQLINIEDVMENCDLGPNGALVYCMEYLEKNLDWFFAQVAPYVNSDHYFLFDLPGQIELYTHNTTVRSILKKIEAFGFRLCAVQLIDSHYCSDPGKFISVLMTVLTTMCQLELPHINVLSKVDLAEQHGRLHFGLEFYTEVLDLQFLLQELDQTSFSKKFHKLNKGLVDVIENYGLVSFLPLSIASEESIRNVRAAADKANGYVFGAGETNHSNLVSLLSTAVGAQFQGEFGGTLCETLLGGGRQQISDQLEGDTGNSMSID